MSIENHRHWYRVIGANVGDALREIEMCLPLCYTEYKRRSGVTYIWIISSCGIIS